MLLRYRASGSRRPLVTLSQCIAALGLAVFGTPSDGASTLNEDELKYPGFQTYPTPRTFDGPGSVFRLTADRHRFSVTSLKVRVEKAGREEFPNYSSDVKWSVSVLAKFLGKVGLFSGPEANAEADREVHISVKLGTGYRERTYDDDIDQAVRNARIAYRRDSRYFVVREAIAVESLSISANPRTSAGVDVSATLNKLAAAEAGVRWADDNRKSLVRTFSPPHYVFYLVDEILPPGPGATGDPVPKRYPMTDEEIRWVDEAADR